MNAAYATDGRQRTKAGGAILAATSVLSAVLVIAGLYYAIGTGDRHKIALAAGACEPNLSPSGLPCTTEQMLASRYTTITAPLVQQLNTDAAAYSAYERHRRVAAEAALMAEVTLQDSFGKDIAQFPFPPADAAKANLLIHANHALVTLCAEQAHSSTFSQLWSYNYRIKVARAAEEADIELLGQALATPPTPVQEP